MNEKQNNGDFWSAQPTAKSRGAVQRSVTALLNELAPERAVRRISQPPGPVEEHRTPSGCVLQAAECAVSVSWFPDSTAAAVLGELHVIVWEGTVSQRGAHQNDNVATIVGELVLRPIEPPEDDHLWQATDGSRYSTELLAAKCLSMLDRERQKHR